MTDSEALAATILMILLLAAYLLGHADGYRKAQELSNPSTQEDYYALRSADQPRPRPHHRP
jgi:hypothetical protein